MGAPHNNLHCENQTFFLQPVQLHLLHFQIKSMRLNGMCFQLCSAMENLVIYDLNLKQSVFLLLSSHLQANLSGQMHWNRCSRPT